MFISMEWAEDFQETSESIQQEVFLLDALALRAEQAGIRDPILAGSFHRLLDYLSQNADDLHHLSHTLEKNVESIQTASRKT